MRGSIGDGWRMKHPDEQFQKQGRFVIAACLASLRGLGLGATPGAWRCSPVSALPKFYKLQIASSIGDVGRLDISVIALCEITG